MRPVRGLARAILGGLFVVAGGQALLRPHRYAAQAQPLVERVAPFLNKIDKRIPTDTGSLVRVNGAMQVGAGLMLATSTLPRPAAAVLAGTLIPATLAGHPFWKIQNPSVRRAEQVQFAKNLGLLSGLLLAAADTAGSPSLRWRVRHGVKDARKHAAHGGHQS